ncbi:MAG: hypothetical protein B6U76_02165 [Desulfurococcales archaeon ex4484_217_2]|nr:MAG: hypothetical protein B6U76_02165 [Desulfurococcales archaeon ex4484_217_2]
MKTVVNTKSHIETRDFHFQRRNSLLFIERMGERAVVFTLKNLRNLARTYLEILGDEFFYIEYERGYRLGLLRFNNTFSRIKDPIERLKKILEFSEWTGAWQVLKWSFNPKTKKGYAIVKNSYWAEVFKPFDRPVCHNLAGYLAAVIGSAYGIELEAEEVECEAKGDKRCYFIIHAY